MECCLANILNMGEVKLFETSEGAPLFPTSVSHTECAREKLD